MYSKQDLKNYLEEISECAQFTKFNFVSTEKFVVQLKCKVDSDRSVEVYNVYVSQWIKKFSTFTATTWIVRNSFPRLKRLVYRKVYTCHRSAFNKKKSATQNTLNQDCKAKIDFRMKFINRNTIKNDVYLKEGLNLTITIDFLHSHKLRTPQAFNMLKSTSDTDDIFYKYFCMGYSPSAAKAYHELILAEKHGKTTENLLNANINPTMRHILYLHGKFKSNDKENQTFEELMALRKASLETAGGFINYDNPQVVIIITSIMRKVISAFKMEHVQINSIKSLTGPVVTYLYVPSKAGALPVACVLHKEKSEANYSQAFLAIKLSLENVCTETFDPKVLTIKDCNEMREACTSIFPNSIVVSSQWSLCGKMWQLSFDEDFKIEPRKRHGLMEIIDNIVRSENIEDGEKYYEKLLREECVMSSSALRGIVEEMWQKCLQRYKCGGDSTGILSEVFIRTTEEFIHSKCKTFNIYVMVDVVCNILERQTRRILLAHAMNLNTAAVYTRLLIDRKTIEDFKAAIKKITTNEYRIEIPNAKNKCVKLRIDTFCCDCVTGRKGRFCEHLCSIINTVETDLMKTQELTDEEKYTFTNIAGGEEAKLIKSEIMNDDVDENVESENDYDDNETDNADIEEEAQSESSLKLEDSNNYYYLEVKTENLEGNDPLEESRETPSINTTIIDHTEDYTEDNNISNVVPEPSTSKGVLKRKYEYCMLALNNEFRRLNKFFKENPNSSNMDTMQRLTKELKKIRPVERADFSDMSITMNIN